MSGPAPAPVEAAEFDALLGALGPFEAAPRIAVAVSGGADSMALAVLAGRWARARGGGALGLTVDHGLRPGSNREARQVGRWLAAHEVDHRVLSWRGAKPARNLQAAARAARYELLIGRCRDHGVLHLLLAHHREDQAETLLLRLGRGSGLDGLAAMAGIAETRDLRRLRPLLSVPKARLVATLEAHGQDWIEDPTNQDARHARVRMRALMPSLAAEGLTARRLAETAGRLGRARAAADDAIARLLARAAEIHPAGYCRLDAEALASAPAEVSLRALARILVAVGGGRYPPRLDRLERLHAALAADALGGGRTLAGCRLAPSGDRVLVCREPAAATHVAAAIAGTRIAWDGRFEVEIAAVRGGRKTPPATLARLGRAGWSEIVAAEPALRRVPVPAPARPSLIALRDADGVIEVPHLGYRRAGSRAALRVGAVRFAAAVPLAVGRFGVV